MAIVEPGDGDWALRGQFFGLRDVAISLAWAVALLLARSIFFRFVFRPFGYRMKQLPLGTPPDAKSELELQKFCKYCWHLLCYIVFWIWALALYVPLPWAFDIDLVWASYPHAPEGKLPFKTIFLVEAGFYIHGLVESIHHDSKRADFLMIVVHHLVAAALIFGCLWGNAHRVGLTVLVEQDVGDIVMYLGKILQQCRALPRVQCRAVHTGFLFLLAVTWFLSRVLGLGLLVHRAWIYGLNTVPGLDPAVYKHPGVLLPGHPEFDAASMVLIVLLSLLLCMQVLWFIGIAWMFLSQLFQGTFHDFILDPEGNKAPNHNCAARVPSARRTSSPPKRPRKIE